MQLERSQRTSLGKTKASAAKPESQSATSSSGRPPLRCPLAQQLSLPLCQDKTNVELAEQAACQHAESGWTGSRQTVLAGEDRLDAELMGLDAELESQKYKERQPGPAGAQNCATTNKNNKNNKNNNKNSNSNNSNNKHSNNRNNNNNNNKPCETRAASGSAWPRTDSQHCYQG
ncbi:unnamed protein product [Polarella glacialis]|uniref:Uncharacterized protein n=1 Tax=Polarella glacialis TaxID=89957 RepID=A0A813DFI9_POLGL|nr:unnamed protein product [Polarella glacialis]